MSSVNSGSPVVNTILIVGSHKTTNTQSLCS